MNTNPARFANRVQLYGYFGKITSTRVEDSGLHKSRLHAGGALRVIEHLSRTSKPVVSIWWVKGYGPMAEWMVIEIKRPVWMGLEGRLRVFKGRSMQSYVSGESRVYVEILNLWLEDIDGDRTSSVTIARGEWERLKKIEAAMKAKPSSRFKIPEANEEQLRSFTVEGNKDYVHEEGHELEPEDTPEGTVRHRGYQWKRKPDGQNGAAK